MDRKQLIVLLLGLICCSIITYSQAFVSTGDSLRKNLSLYIGKVWINKYYNVEGTQFLYSPEYLSGTVIMNGKRFTGVSLKYDALDDELITPAGKGLILQVNREMVDSFSLKHDNEISKFSKIPSDTNDEKGFFNVLYEGKISLYVKYRKAIELMAAYEEAVENKYDKIYETRRIFLYKDNELIPFMGKAGLYKMFGNYKSQVKEYLRRNHLPMARSNPASFVPALKFYDSICNK